MMRYAEHTPDPSRDHAAFEAFIRDLDAGVVNALVTVPRDANFRQLDLAAERVAKLG